jgi:DNA recombination protein RmuC
LSKFDLLGKKIVAVQEDYDALATTRRRQLERPLNKIEELRNEKSIPIMYEDTMEEDDQ